MPDQVTLYRVILASPSDVADERAAAKEVIYQWNASNSRSMKIIFEPVLWETHSTPESSRRTQAIINAQIVDISDVLIGIFGTRIGTRTGKAASGTIEEIERFISEKKPTLLYFSRRKMDPSAIKIDQYEALRKFKLKYGQKGLYTEYKTVDDLRQQLSNHLTRLAYQLQEARPHPIHPIPDPIRNYLRDFPDRYIEDDIKSGCVKTSPGSLFEAVRYIYDSLEKDEEVICTDYLNLDKAFFRRYWPTKGLKLLRINYEASTRGIRIKRIFIFTKRTIEKHKDLIMSLCCLHKLAGVKPMIAIYEELEREYRYEFALFADRLTCFHNSGHRL